MSTGGTSADRTGVTPGDGLRVLPVRGIGEIRPGDDLAGLLASAAPWLADGDVVVVTSKIISKAEGRLVPVPPDGPGYESARAAVLAGQTARVVATRGQTQIVVTHHGFVLAAAGVDASNVERGYLVLLPADPDASARALRAGLRARAGVDVAVIISDTMGRPWRVGLTDVALGAAGIDALRDHRGEADAHGNELVLTEMAVIDELCAAAELVKGKSDQIPVAVVRGLGVLGQPDGTGARPLVRPAEQDMFALGTAEARREGLRAAASLGGTPPTGTADPTRFADAPVDAGTVARALDLVGSAALRLLDAGTRDKLTDGVAGTPEVVLGVAGDLVAAAGTGADLHRLRAALAAENLVSAWLPVDAEQCRALVPVPPGYQVVALLAVGHPATPG